MRFVFALVLCFAVVLAQDAQPDTVAQVAPPQTAAQAEVASNLPTSPLMEAKDVGSSEPSEIKGVQEETASLANEAVTEVQAENVPSTPVPETSESS